jgi:ABC-type multidrug transport system ATPase subunit
VESPLDAPAQPGSAPEAAPAVRARTIILTTHQPKLAEPLAETTLTMKAGAIISLTTRPQAASAMHGGER